MEYEKIELHFKPNYLVLFLSAPITIGMYLISILLFAEVIPVTKDNTSEIFPIMFVFIGSAFISHLYNSLKSIQRSVTVIRNSTELHFYEKDLLGEDNYAIEINGLERVWIYQLSKNYFKVTTTIRYGNRYGTVELFEIRGRRGYLSEEDLQRFITFLKIHSPQLQIGYDDY